MDGTLIVKEGYKDKMKSRLYGLLCEREKNGEWEKFLDTLQIELQAYQDKNKTIEYYILCSKLSSCRYLSYKYFRKTIFECMELFEKVNV